MVDRPPALPVLLRPSAVVAVSSFRQDGFPVGLRGGLRRGLRGGEGFEEEDRAIVDFEKIVIIKYRH